MDWAFLETFDNSFWVNFLTKGALVATAGFGLLALLTDYKKDGRITKWGRVAAGGIVVSAMLSIATGIFQDRIKAASDAAEAAHRKDLNDDLGAQLEALRKLGQDSRMIEQSMVQANARQASIIKLQNSLLDRAEQSMLLTARLSSEGNTNTGRVLKGMWGEANRIDGKKIKLFAAIDCRREIDPEISYIFQKGAVATIYFSKRAKAAARGISQVSDNSTDQEAIALESSDMTFPEIRGTGTVSQFNNFYELSRNSIAKISNPVLWRDLDVSLNISAPINDDYEKFVQKYITPSNLSKLDPGYEAELPCDVFWQLDVLDRTIGYARGKLIFYKDAKGPGSLVGRSGRAEINYDYLPRYTG